MTLLNKLLRLFLNYWAWFLLIISGCMVIGTIDMRLWSPTYIAHADISVGRIVKFGVTTLFPDPDQPQPRIKREYLPWYVDAPRSIEATTDLIDRLIVEYGDTGAADHGFDARLAYASKTEPNRRFVSVGVKCNEATECEGLINHILERTLDAHSRAFSNFTADLEMQIELARQELESLSGYAETSDALNDIELGVIAQRLTEKRTRIAQLEQFKRPAFISPTKIINGPIVSGNLTRSGLIAALLRFAFIGFLLSILVSLAIDSWRNSRTEQG